MRRPKRHQAAPKWANAYTPTVNIGLLTHPVFLSLTPAARLVCLVMHIEMQRAAHNRSKEQGRPVFRWSAYDSERHLQMSKRHHFNAVTELKNKGFIEVVQPGGLLGCNGTPNTYTLSSAWSRMQLPAKTTAPAILAKMENARNQIGKPTNGAAQVQAQKPVNTVAVVKQRKPLESFKQLPPYLSSEQPQTGQRAYTRPTNSVRAIQIKLIEPVNDGRAWVIKPNRTGQIINPLPTVIQLSDIIPVDLIQAKKTARMSQEKQHTEEYNCTAPANTIAPRHTE